MKTIEQKANFLVTIRGYTREHVDTFIALQLLDTIYQYEEETNKEA